MEKQGAVLNKADFEAKFFHALSDPSRLSILRLLLDQERSVNDIAAGASMSQSCVSNHLACLRNCNFVSVRQEGRKVYYSLRHPEIRSILEIGEKLVRTHAEELARCTGCMEG